MNEIVCKITDLASGEIQFAAFTPKVWQLIVSESAYIQDNEFYNAGQIIEAISSQRIPEKI